MSSQLLENFWIIVITTCVILVLIIGFITLLILSNRRLRQQHKFIKRVLNTTSAFILILNEAGEIIHYNKAYESLVGNKLGEIEKAFLKPYMLKDDENISKPESLHRFEKNITTNDGQQRIISWSQGKIKDIHGNLQLIFTGIDITEEKNAYEKLRISQKQLRALAAELSISEERERRKIAGELHDRIGPSLSLVKIKLGELREDSFSTESDQIISHIEQLISQTIQDTRTLIFEISPPILQELGFTAAVNWLAEKISKEHNINVVVESKNKIASAMNDINIILYRAVRELLINIVKHSKARKATILIRRENNHLYLKIDDDGIGFKGTKRGGEGDYLKGFGLFNIKESIIHHGGVFNIDSKPDFGTYAEIKVPLLKVQEHEN